MCDESLIEPLKETIQPVPQLATRLSIVRGKEWQFNERTPRRHGDVQRQQPEQSSLSSHIPLEKRITRAMNRE